MTITIQKRLWKLEQSMRVTPKHLMVTIPHRYTDEQKQQLGSIIRASHPKIGDDTILVTVTNYSSKIEGLSVNEIANSICIK